jgi:radical SAM superfamily enzyme YgiQ (UPF0313 family)
MKILLVKTEQLGRVACFYVPPLGILSLAAVAEEQGHDVRIVDLALENRAAKIQRRLADEAARRPDVVGVSALSFHAPTFRVVTAFFHKQLPLTPLLAGGPHASNDPAAILKEGFVHCCVYGESEHVFPRILERLSQHERLDDLPGVSYRRGSDVATNPPPPLVDDLDSLPFPAWHHHRFSQARWLPGPSARAVGRQAAVFTSRGCPFHCIFCHDYFGKRFRARSPDNVLAEIALLRSQYGVRFVEFVDDIFNFDRARTMAILRGVADRFSDVDIAFPIGLRSDLLDEEVIRAMRDARCREVAVAVETGSERLQKAIRKNADLTAIRENLRLLRKNGIFSDLYLMIGFPMETAGDLQATTRFVVENAKHFNWARIFIVSPWNRENELHKMIADEAAQGAVAGARRDYYWGNATIGKIPFADLERMARYCRSRTLFRLRNIPAVFMLAKSGLFRLLFFGEFRLLRTWHELLIVVLSRGLGKKVIDDKWREEERLTNRLAKALDVERSPFAEVERAT